MIARHQLAVRSPIAVRGLLAAVAAATLRDRSHFGELAKTLREHFDARRATFTDSGTSALVLALRLAAGDLGTVAFPAFGCIDLTAAAVRAGIRVRLYDLDPSTLSPDLDSLERTLRRGADAILVAHLYGYPADMPGVQALADAHGAPVIEDAAQAAGASLGDRPVGAFGGLTVLSFGRGKGVTGGRGGALLTRDARWLAPLERHGAALGVPGAGWANIATAAAQWLLGRPSVYALPAAIPWLNLGDMVYRRAEEPSTMSAAAAALVRHAWTDAGRELATRRRHAARLEDEAARTRGLLSTMRLRGARAGYLRLAARDTAGRSARPALGIMPAYPRTLAEQSELAPCLHAGERSPAGAIELRRTLFTLPTHGALIEADLRRIGAWIAGAGVPVSVEEVRDMEGSGDVAPSSRKSATIRV
jgi:hypothetical protein